MTASKAATMLLGLFYYIYAARYLGTESFGILSYALALGGILVVLFDMGMDVFLAREVSRAKSLTSKYIHNLLTLRLLLYVLYFGTTALFVNLTSSSRDTIIVVYLITLSFIFIGFKTMFFAAFQAHEKMGYIALPGVLDNACFLLGGLILINKGFGLIAFALLYVVVEFLLLTYAIVIFTWQFSFPKLQIDWTFWKQSIKVAWPLGALAFLVVIYFRTDAVMLSLMKGDAAVGIYSAAYKASEATTFIPTMFVYALFPLLSRYHEQDLPSFKATYQKAVRYMIYLALPVSFLVTLLSKPIISLLYGPKYEASAGALAVLIWASAIMFVTMVLGNALIAANRQKTMMKLAFLTALVNIALNLILIPPFSYIGSSIATVVTEVLGLFIGFYLLSRYGYKPKPKQTILVPLLYFAAPLSIAILLVAFNVNIYLIAAIVVCTFSIIVLVFGINAEDKRMIRELFQLSHLKNDGG